MHLRALGADHDPLLTEVDLELRARERLEPHRRELCRAARLAVRLERALQRPQRHIDVAVGEEPLYDDGVAGGGAIEQLARQRRLLGIERPRGGPRLNFGRGAATQVPPHAVARDAQLTRDPLAAPAKLLQ